MCKSRTLPLHDLKLYQTLFYADIRGLHAAQPPIFTLLLESLHMTSTIGSLFLQQTYIEFKKRIKEGGGGLTKTPLQKL